MNDHQLKSLIQRLRGEYRIPITDGLGAVGGGEEPDNPNEFVRRFETPPIQKEAAEALERLQGKLRMIVSHATMGTTDGEYQTTNDICVQITALRNKMYQAGKDAAMKKDAHHG